MARGGSAGEYPDYSIVDPRQLPPGPDVLLDLPQVKVDEIDIEVDELQAQVAVRAEVRDVLELGVGAQVGLGKVELKIEGVEAQALLKARLDNVALMLERVLSSLDRNPELLERAGHATEEVGRGAERAREGVGRGVAALGEGAGRATGKLSGEAGS